MSALIAKMTAAALKTRMCDGDLFGAWMDQTEYVAKDMQNVVRAALRAAEEAGWVMVPREWDGANVTQDMADNWTSVEIYRELIESAPKPAIAARPKL